MLRLQDVVNVELLNEHIENGFVTARQHNEYPLTILNYTPACQFARGWDEVTLKCRGLIYNHETGELLARPFEKFFNWDEMGQTYPPSGPVLRMEKLDGSLGILVATDYSNGTPTRELVATRGSFHSDQAEWATKFYLNLVVDQANDGPIHTVFSPIEGKTYLFEIIYPENRIVVDYGDYNGMVLLDVIDNETGRSDTDEFDNCAWPDKVKRIPMGGFDSGHQGDIPSGEEGFVYLWPTRGRRIKMKSAEYIELHKLVTGLSEKTVWEQLCAGKTVTDIQRPLPEEFHIWVDEVAAKIQREATDIVTEVYHALDLIEYEAGFRYDMLTRKEFAEYAKRHGRLAKYLFMVLDNKPIYPVALREAKPQREDLLVQEV